MQMKMESDFILAMYDVRGIQNYIFRTNKVKEVIGASGIVEHIIQDALAYAVKQKQMTQEAILSWENEEELLIFQEGSNISIQVLFSGGGNAYVMYRDREIAVGITKHMSRFVLDKTYSLQLAVAMVKKTASYQQDYQNVQNEMSRIKASMPFSRCLGALPIIAMDDMTGFPYSMDDKENLKNKIEYTADLCSESTQKLMQYYEMMQQGNEKYHDNLITEKGKQSIIAVVHIDGNNMGIRIQELMEHYKTYESAVKKMRTISKNISNSFKDAYGEMETYLKQWIQSDENYILKKSGVYLRKIIVAGDDITFVCNAKIALSLVRYFIQQVSQRVMNGEQTKENIEKYGLSVCAGIAYVHSHFPFSVAYHVAEECCDSAKKRAKADENKQKIYLKREINGKEHFLEQIGNWVDFQICKNVQMVDLEGKRKKHYQIAEGENLLRRPYYIEVGQDDIVSEETKQAYFMINEKNRKYAFSIFEELYAYFSDDKKIPSSMAKKLRNTYPLGRYAVEEYLQFIESRGRLTEEIKREALSGKKESLGYIMQEEQMVAAWYDVLEMLDLYDALGTKIEKTDVVETEAGE